MSSLAEAFRRYQEERASRDPRQEFERGFKRSKKGNLWCHYNGLIVSVFKQSDGGYGWCVAGEDDKRYSSHEYETEEEAIEALSAELEIGII